MIPCRRSVYDNKPIHLCTYLVAVPREVRGWRPADRRRYRKGCSGAQHTSDRVCLNDAYLVNTCQTFLINGYVPNGRTVMVSRSLVVARPCRCWVLMQLCIADSNSPQEPLDDGLTSVWPETNTRPAWRRTSCPGQSAPVSSKPDRHAMRCMSCRRRIGWTERCAWTVRLALCTTRHMNVPRRGDSGVTIASVGAPAQNLQCPGPSCQRMISVHRSLGETYHVRAVGAA